MTSFSLSLMSYSTVQVLLIYNMILTCVCIRAVNAEDYFQQPTDTDVKITTSHDRKSPPLMQLLTSLSNELPQTSPTDSAIYTEDGDLPGVMVVPTAKRIFCNQYVGCRSHRPNKRLTWRQRMRGLRRRNRTTGKRFTKRFLYPSFPDNEVSCTGPHCFQGTKTGILQSGFGGLQHRGPTSDVKDSNPTGVSLPGFRGVNTRGPATGRGGRPGMRDSKAKKVFCNHYTGCVGRRNSLLDARGGQVRPIEMPITERPWERMKRFFAGGFDNDMQSLMDSIDR